MCLQRNSSDEMRKGLKEAKSIPITFNLNRRSLIISAARRMSND